MLNVLIGSIVFIIGFVAGSYFRAAVFDNQPWTIYRWDANVLGHRPIQLGAMIYRGDRILMGLDINTEGFPTEGIPYE